MEDRKNLKPYSIRMVISGYTYNFHGFEKRFGRPNFIIGYACLDTNFYWRTYKQANRAIAEGLKVKRYFDIRKAKYEKIEVFDNLTSEVIAEL